MRKALKGMKRLRRNGTNSLRKMKSAIRRNRVSGYVTRNPMKSMGAAAILTGAVVGLMSFMRRR